MNRNKIKAMWMIFCFRFMSIFDVMFAERFEIKTYKNGRKTSTTKFCKKEICDIIGKRKGETIK